jgi:hypothetical protein
MTLCDFRFVILFIRFYALGAIIMKCVWSCVYWVCM